MKTLIKIFFLAAVLTTASSYSLVSISSTTVIINRAALNQTALPNAERSYLDAEETLSTSGFGSNNNDKPDLPRPYFSGDQLFAASALHIRSWIDDFIEMIRQWNNAPASIQDIEEQEKRIAEL